MITGASDNQAKFRKLCEEYSQVGDLGNDIADKAEKKLLDFLKATPLDSLNFNEKVSGKSLFWMITLIAANARRGNILKLLLVNNKNLKLFDFNVKGSYGALGEMSVLSLIAFIGMRGLPECMEAITASDLDLKKLHWNEKGIEDLTPLWMVAKVAQEGNPKALQAILSKVPKAMLKLQVKPTNGLHKDKTVQMLIDAALAKGHQPSINSKPTQPTPSQPVRPPFRFNLFPPTPSTIPPSNNGNNVGNGNNLGSGNNIGNGNNGGNGNKRNGNFLLTPSLYPNRASLAVGILASVLLASQVAAPALLLSFLAATMATRIFLAVRNNLYHRYPGIPVMRSAGEQAAYHHGKAAAHSLTAYFKTFVSINDWRHSVTLGNAMQQELESNFSKPKRS